MISVSGSSPAISATRAGCFPRRPGFGTAWTEILETSRAWRELDCAEYVRGWCGYAPAHIVDKFTGVHHVGIYMGDYEGDDEVFAWNAYLNDLPASVRGAAVEMGPSYIAPRKYGTPGWWNSVVLPGGRAIEMFACKKFGAWAERSADERGRLMSHVAVEVRSDRDVRSVLEVLDRDVPTVEIIAFTRADELGHTYGHVRNNATSSVLEIVYEAPRDDHGWRDGAH